MSIGYMDDGSTLCAAMGYHSGAARAVRRIRSTRITREWLDWAQVTIVSLDFYLTKPALSSRDCTTVLSVSSCVVILLLVTY